ncbi:MAG: hypothetical protein ABR910_11180 [Acidobacteriaceae bacterium]|jgi:hypothetical protein
MNPKAVVIVSRTYQKGGEFLSLFVRELSGGDIDGSMFQLEIWKNNKEDVSLRETSGDMFYIRGRYFRKLLDLLDERDWKKTSAGVFAHPHTADFNPEVL